MYGMEIYIVNQKFDAKSVAEFVEYARRSLLTLEKNLRSLGYRFSNPNGPVQLADGSSMDSVRSLERRYGDIPALF